MRGTGPPGHGAEEEGKDISSRSQASRQGLGEGGEEMANEVRRGHRSEERGRREMEGKENQQRLGEGGPSRAQGREGRRNSSKQGRTGERREKRRKGKGEEQGKEEKGHTSERRPQESRRKGTRQHSHGLGTGSAQGRQRSPSAPLPSPDELHLPHPPRSTRPGTSLSQHPPLCSPGAPKIPGSSGPEGAGPPVPEGHPHLQG